MKTRTVLDVSRLPTVGFGQTSLMWWGTLGVMVVYMATWIASMFGAWPADGSA